MFATPMAYFAAHELGCGSAVAVTGSHNPPEYNGLKMVLAGTTLAGEDVQKLRRRIESGELARGAGLHRRVEIREAYLNRITSDVRLARPMKIAVDCGNGVAGATAGELYRRLGCEVLEIYCEVDGRREHHFSGPAADVVREGRAFAPAGRRDHLRRQKHTQPRALDPRAWRCAEPVEDRSLAHQGADARARRGARGRDERPHFLRRTLVRVRRRAVRRGAPAGDPEQDGRRHCDAQYTS